VLVIGYSIGACSDYLQKDLGSALVWLPADHVASLLFFVSGFFWGWVSDRIADVGVDPTGDHRHSVGALYLFTRTTR